MSKRLVIAFLVLLPSIIFSQYQPPGSSVAQFLNIGVHARAEAMGGAYISVADGPEGVYYNPEDLVLLWQNL